MKNFKYFMFAILFVCVSFPAFAQQLGPGATALKNSMTDEMIYQSINFYEQQEALENNFMNAILTGNKEVAFNSFYELNYKMDPVVKLAIVTALKLFFSTEKTPEDYKTIIYLLTEMYDTKESGCSNDIALRHEILATMLQAKSN